MIDLARAMTGRGTGFEERRPVRHVTAIAAGLVAVALAGLVACQKESVTPPPPRTPGVLVVTTTAELDNALRTSVAGDTIEIRGEFSSPTFTLTRGYSIPASRSPLRIVGIARSTLRPVLVFPDSVTGLTFTGHSGSSVANLDFQGGADVFHLVNSNVDLYDLNVLNNSRDGVLAEGSSGGAVDSCFFQNPGRFGVDAQTGANLTIRNNTIIGAGDGGIFLDSNATVRNNNVVLAARNGVVCGEHAASPLITCNNVFQSGVGPNYACGDHAPPQTNFELDPLFCPGDFTLKENSPLAPANSGGCGLIGKFGPACFP